MNISIKIGFVKHYIGLLDDYKNINFNDNKRLCYMEDFTEFVAVFPNELVFNEKTYKQLTISMLLNKTGYTITYDDDKVKLIALKLNDKFVIEKEC